MYLFLRFNSYPDLSLVMNANKRPIDRFASAVPLYVQIAESLLDRILNAGGEGQENFYLQNGDIVLVP